jgi:hypothetical protein
MSPVVAVEEHSVGCSAPSSPSGVPQDSSASAMRCCSVGSLRVAANPDRCRTCCHDSLWEPNRRFGCRRVRPASSIRLPHARESSPCSSRCSGPAAAKLAKTNACCRRRTPSVMCTRRTRPTGRVPYARTARNGEFGQRRSLLDSNAFRLLTKDFPHDHARAGERPQRTGTRQCRVWLTLSQQALGSRSPFLSSVTHGLERSYREGGRSWLLAAPGARACFSTAMRTSISGSG